MSSHHLDHGRGSARQEGDLAVGAGDEALIGLRRVVDETIGHVPGSTVFFPRLRAQYAAPPIIVLKLSQSGSTRVSHSLGSLGRFHNSTQSK